MFQLHLYEASQPDVEVERRALGVDPIVMGRDDDAGWKVPGDDRQISRRHVEITPVGNRIRLKALGRTGISLTPNSAPVPPGGTGVIGDGDGFSFGNFTVVARQATLKTERALNGDAPASPSALLDAFLEGAGLESSAFTVDDPAEIMRRAGAMYMQAVSGLCDLVAERNAVKESLAIDQTTISAGDNNPLRWGAPHRVAIDLLRSNEPGFLNGTDAFEATLNDVRLHLAASTAGYRAAIADLFDRLSPDGFAGAGAKPAFLKSGARKWEAFEAAHAQLRAEASDSALPMRRAFAAGYETHLKDKADGDDA